MTTTARRPTAQPPRSPDQGPPPRRSTVVLAASTAALATVSSTVGLLAGGGAGRHEVVTARGGTVTLYGEGLYEADSWLVGAGNTGQDAVLLLVEVPVLVAAVLLYRSGHRLGAAALAGVLSFFLYYAASLTFATAQNRLFPVYIAMFSTALFGFVRAVLDTDLPEFARRFPHRPGTRALQVYLLAVAFALTLAWLPEVVGTAITGDVAEAVGHYTSGATHAIDLGVVVPVAVLAAVLLGRGASLGPFLAFQMLVLNVLIGILLIGQGAAQLSGDVPLTVVEIVAKMASFALLTLVAGILLLRLARSSERHAP